MECYDTQNIITLPVCVGESYCACFDSLFTDESKNELSKHSILDYTDLNLREVARYLTELTKHVNKDNLLKEQNFSQVPAFEVKQANNAFQATIEKLKTYQSLNDRDNRFTFYYFGKRVSCSQIVNLYDKIGETQDMSLRYLNTPTTLMSINILFEVLHLHQIALYILQQFYHIVTYKKILFLESSPFINVCGFRFQ